ncbi:MAG: SIMPL domain-containing protein [Cyanobacteria bacterium P01_D01_bin.56]
MQKLLNLTKYLLPWTLVILIISFPAYAQETSNPRLLSVIGHGHSPAATTLAQITLGVTNNGDSAKATYDAITRRSVAVAKLLDTNKVEIVKTSNINLNPQYGRDGNPAKATYEGYQNIQFQLPVSKMAVLDKALATDVDSLQSIRYLASEEAITIARDQALKNAIADAQAQAKVALDKLSLSAQEIIDIRIDDPRVENPAIQPGTADKSYSSSRASSHLPVESGEQIVDVQVTLQVRY